MRVVWTGSLLCALAAVACFPAVAAEEAPAWLQQAASASLPAYDSTVPAVVLLDEERVTVEASGRIVTTHLYAVKVLTQGGRDEARARQIYRTDTGKVKELRAWMLPPTGPIRKYGKEETVDVALHQNDVYNEVRLRAIMARQDALPGSVFGYEAVSEDKSVFTQAQYQFQTALPVLAARYALTLPPGWRAEAVTFNHAAITPVVSGTTWTWELTHLPFLKDEVAQPAISALAPRLAVSFVPPSGVKTEGRVITSWTDVSQWLTELNEPQSVPNDDITAKAKSLIASMDGEFARIQALGRYVQGVKYVAIQTGVGRGGGYRPHTAADVFAKSYGDCKDKANLLRAMLKVVGIISYPVAIYSGDRAYVRPEWASPQQFNHAILAVKVSDAVSAPAVVTHPALGRLLLFDPTDEHTAVGELPEHEQDSQALVAAGDKGTLLRVPSGAAAANRLERHTEVTLEATGAMQAKIRERSYGFPAARERAGFRQRSAQDYQKMLEHWVNRGVPGAVISALQPVDKQDQGEFELSVELSSPRFAKPMAGHLLVFKPELVDVRQGLSFIEKTRTHPITLYANAYQETVRVKLPAGYSVDEMPQAATLTTPFALYANSYKVEGDTLIFTRSLEIKSVTLPPTRYEEVRTFFSQMHGADDQAVVLAKQ